jgi:hypothetical protein
LNDALRRLENAKTESAVAEIKEVPIQPLEPSVVSEAAKLTDGMIVLVHDLKNAAELNGQLGTVKGFMQESGRWVVELPCLGAGATRNILAINLEKVMSAEELPPVPDDDGDADAEAVAEAAAEAGEAEGERAVGDGRKKGYAASGKNWNYKVRAKLVEDIEKYTSDKTEVAKLLLSVARKLGAQEELRTEVNVAENSYNSELLLTRLGEARQTLKHHPAAVVRILDAAVAPACSNYDRLQKKYNMPKPKWREMKQAGGAAGVVGVKRTIEKLGKPNKVDDPDVLKVVEKELCINSQASSWLGVVPGRKKGQPRKLVKVRVLTALLSTIFFASHYLQRIVKLFTFRRICAKHFRHYRRARVKTDLCDHCETYRLKTVPRLRTACGEWRVSLNNICTDYWKVFNEDPRYETLVASQDHLATLDAMEDYICTHDQKHQDHRNRQDFPAKITHVEAGVLKQLRLHRKIVSSYEWHILAAARESGQARRDAEEPKPNEATGQGDFMEKVGIPQAHRQTSDMFHGSQRKTLSVFGFYIAQRNAEGKVEKTGVILVSDVVETTACYANLCVEQAVAHVKRLGELDMLRLRFDTGNHFRSYESLASFCWKIPHKYDQRTLVGYHVEKHGKCVCDSEIFSPCRRWTDEALANPKALIESEEQLVEVYRAGAERDMRGNPTGMKWIIELVKVPEEKPLTAKVLKFRGSTVEVTHVNRSYCWEAVVDKRYPCGIHLYNHIFTNMPDMPVDFRPIQPSMVLEDKCLERKSPTKKGAKQEKNDDNPDEPSLKPGQWRRGYWQDCTWRKPGLKPGEVNEIVRTYDDQAYILGKQFLGRRKKTAFEDEVAKAESRLDKAAARTRKRTATLTSLAPSLTDSSGSSGS